jgi:multidrug efflux pump subunit AcrA (membrane-fusion protein)
MTLSPRDRRALLILAPAVAISLTVYFWPESGGAAPVATEFSIERAEQRLARLRQRASAVPDRSAATQRAAAALAAREKGLIQAETAAQAQAQMLQIVRRITRAQQPPVDVRNIDLGTPRPLGPNYGEVQVVLTVSCRVEQLVNLLADLGNQTELISTNEIQIGQAAGKEKLLQARLGVSGLVPRKLIPEKKQESLF